MKGVYVFLADGFEETEALAPLDILRRGGVEAKTVSINDGKVVTGAHGVPVTADLSYDEFTSGIANGMEALVFPGGMPGTKNLAAHEGLMDMMKSHYAEGGLLAAICAAPGLVISQLPDLEGVKFTCYDGFEAPVIAKGGEYVKAPAVTCGKIITGRGPACAVDFGLAILGALRGEELADKVGKAMMLD